MVVLSVAAVVVVRRLHLLDRGKTTPVSVDEALDRYRESGSTTTVPAVAPTGVPSTEPATSTVSPAPAGLPAEGVYTYETTGRDSVDALNGDHHDYPATSTITVTAGDCGVVQRWDVAAERWSSWTRCLAGEGVAQTAKEDFDRFFGTDQLDSYTCSGDPRPLNAAPGTTWTFSCTEGGEVQAITGTVVGPESRTVGGEQVDTLHVQTSIDDGDAGDSQVTDTWYLAGTDLIVNQRGANATTNPSPVGDVHYREDYEISLTSLTPLT